MTLRVRVAVSLCVIAAFATIIVSFFAVRITEANSVKVIDRSLERIANISDLETRLSEKSSRPVEEALIPTGAFVQVQSPNGDSKILWGEQAVQVPPTANVPQQAQEQAQQQDPGEPIFLDTVASGQPYRSLVQPSVSGGTLIVSRELSPTNELIDDLVFQLTITGVVVTLAAGLVGYWVASSMLRPLDRLTRAAEHIAETGDLKVDIRTSRSDETGRLSRAFDEMLAALVAAQDSQQRLLQDAGHELRTPVASLMSNAETLQRYPDLDSDTRAQIAKDLMSESQELARMIAALVDLTGVLDDSEPIQKCHAKQLCEATAHRLPAGVRGRIHVVGDAGLEGRPNQLQRALLNILSNAIKFSPPDSEIQMDISVADGYVRIDTRDRGPGVPEEDVPFVFDRFKRAAEARQFDGSGLGLAIVTEICRHNGGSAELWNHPDGGAVVRISLPEPASSVS